MLNNRRYIGGYSYREVVTPNGIPDIVPKDMFDRVEEKTEKNKKAPARHKAEDDYLLTTKLFCGYCGAYLCVESGTSRTGIVRHCYKCVSVKRKRAERRKKPVKKAWIEELSRRSCALVAVSRGSYDKHRKQMTAELNIRPKGGMVTEPVYYYNALITWNVK